MIHTDESILYKFVLETLDPGDYENVKSHLKECNLCSKKIINIKKEIELISSYNPDIELAPPGRKTINKFSRTWLKAAAALAIGLTIGYTASNYLTGDKTVVVGQSFTPDNYMIDTLNYAFCPNIDISTIY